MDKKQTDRITDAAKRFTPATIDGMSSAMFRGLHNMAYINIVHINATLNIKTCQHNSITAFVKHTYKNSTFES